MNKTPTSAEALQSNGCKNFKNIPLVLDHLKFRYHVSVDFVSDYLQQDRKDLLIDLKSEYIKVRLLRVIQPDETVIDIMAIRLDDFISFLDINRKNIILKIGAE